MPARTQKTVVSKTGSRLTPKGSHRWFVSALKFAAFVILIGVVTTHVLNVRKSCKSAVQASNLQDVCSEAAAALAAGDFEPTLPDGTWWLVLTTKGTVVGASERHISDRQAPQNTDANIDHSYSLDGYVFNAKNVMAEIVKKSRYFNGGFVVFDREDDGKVRRQSAYVCSKGGDEIVLVAQQQV